MLIEYKDSEWLERLKKYIEEGYIRVQSHPRKRLKIYNYTQKAQSEAFWDEVTMACRGLVLDDKGRVVVECPKKFFNMNEPLAAKFDLKKAIISDKLDGYYISVRKDSYYGLVVTSRGSFDNKYVEAAQDLLGDETLVWDTTYFFELCKNFEGDEGIIVTKHERPKLVLWGIRNSDGKWVNDLDGYTKWESAKVFSLKEAEKYLKTEVEGVVAFDPVSGDRVKIKTDWFVQRHKMISNCTKKHVWEVLAMGERVANMDFPDELLPQMKEWESELIGKFTEEWHEIYQLADFFKRFNKKEIALSDDIPKEYKPFLFSLYDGNVAKAKEMLWKRIMPKGS